MTDIVGVSRTPIGVFDHPPDPDLGFVKGINVGGSGLAVITRKLTSVGNDVNKWLGDLSPFP